MTQIMFSTSLSYKESLVFIFLFSKEILKTKVIEMSYFIINLEIIVLFMYLLIYFSVFGNLMSVTVVIHQIVLQIYFPRISQKKKNRNIADSNSIN